MICPYFLILRIALGFSWADLLYWSECLPMQTTFQTNCGLLCLTTFLQKLRKLLTDFIRPGQVFGSVADITSVSKVYTSNKKQERGQVEQKCFVG